MVVYTSITTTSLRGMFMKNEDQRYQELGDFLKTRRAKITPEQAGITSVGRRRTPGLRREEVATLAGISLTWYTWLEQGREIQVSEQVVQSLVKVLQLNMEESTHLYDLAQVPVPIHITPFEGAINPMLQHMIDSLEYSPTLILDSRWNIVGTNHILDKAVKLEGISHFKNENLLRLMFTNAKFMATMPEWSSVAEIMTGRFRKEFGRNIEDPWMNDFVDQLIQDSTEFTRLWALHDINSEEEHEKTFQNDKIGDVSFEETSFDVSGNMQLKMYVFTPKDEISKSRIKKLNA